MLPFEPVSSERVPLSCNKWRPVLNYDHEAAVKAFMDAARMSDPEKHAVVCSKYPVKSNRQMRSIAEIEIPVGLHPEAFAELHHLGSHRLVANATGLGELEEAS